MLMFGDQFRPIYGNIDAELLAMSDMTQRINNVTWLHENCMHPKPIKNNPIKKAIKLIKTIFNHRIITISRIILTLYKIIRDIIGL